MANAEFYGEKKVGSDVYGVKVTCTSAPNVATNSSDVTLEARLIHDDISISKRQYPTHNCTYDIAGTTYTYETPAINKAGKETDAPIVTKTVTIQHDSDGTKSVDVIFNFPYNLKRSSDGVRVNTVTAGGTFVLDRIGRASTIAEQTREVAANGTGTWHIRMNRASDQFWHKGKIAFGSVTIELPAFAAETSAVIPASWQDQMPNSTSGTAYVTIQTYSDESCTAEIGDEIATTFTVEIPDGAGPTLGDRWATYYKTTSRNVNAYVQGHTKITATFYASRVTPAEGTTIHSWWVILEGKTYTKGAEYKNGVLQDATLTTDIIAGSGTTLFRFGVTDSRGVSRYVDVTKDVYAYSKPRITSVSVFRCDANGNKDDDGTAVAANATMVYSECGGENSATLTFYARQTGQTAYDIEKALTSGKQSVFTENYNAQKSYEVSIIAVDALGELASYKTVIGTSDVSFHIKKGGKAAAFGKYAESDNALEVAWDLLAKKKIIDQNGNEVIGAQLSADVKSKTITVPSNHEIATLSYGLVTCDTRYGTFKPGLYIVIVNTRWLGLSGEGSRALGIYRCRVDATDGTTDCDSYSYCVMPGAGDVMPTQNAYAIVPLEQGEWVMLQFEQDSGSDMRTIVNYQVAKIGG